MATVDTIYTIAGGAWFQNTLNGVAAFMGSSAGESLLAMGTVLSVSVGALSYIKTRNLLELVKWAGFYVLVIAVLLGIKRDVQVVDLSNPAAIYQVDNVPAGIAVPASIITRVGAGLAQAYDYVFAQADALSYSKTGMLFGAALAGSATDFTFMNAQEQQMFTDYVRNCVVGDIMLNKKYSWGDLTESTDPYTLIFSKPSPLRGLYSGREFITCEAAAVILKDGGTSISGSQLGPYYQQVLQALHGFTNQVFGNNNSNTALFAEMLGDSYNFFHATSMTSTDIIRRNVVINGLRQGLNGFAAESNDTAGLLNVATTTSLAKMRLSQATGASIGTHTLPVMQSVLLGMTIALFPVLIVLALVSSLSFAVLRGYVLTIAYLQMWPLLFSILNHAMNFYLQSRLGGVAVVLSNIDQVQNTYSDIGTTAGWLALSIPFIAWGMVKGLGQVMSQAGSYLGQTMQSSATQSSGQAVDGNWSFNNMQTGNVQGNKWDTNYSRQEGQMTRQLESGAMVTQTQGGDQVYNTTSAMSKLPVDVMLGKTAASNWQAQQRDSMSQVQSLSNSISHSTSLGASQLTQWGQQRGNSDTVVAGSDSSRGSNFNQAMNTLSNITSRYARDNNVSEADALRKTISESENASIGYGASGNLKWDSGDMIPGKVGKWATGVSAGVEGHVKGDKTDTSGSSRGTSSDATSQAGHSKGFSAQELKDAREALDVITSQRVTDNGSHSQNEAGSLTNQIASNFSDMRSQVSQYNDALNRSHEYAQLASYAENNSASIQSNYAQEFVGYVQSTRADAETVLTNTSSPQVRAEREHLAEQFVEDKLKPQLLQEFEHNRSRTGEGMGGISASGDLQQTDLQQQFTHDRGTIEGKARDAGVSGAGVVTSTVAEQRGKTSAQIDKDSTHVADSKQAVQKEYTTLQQEHQGSETAFNTAKAAEQKTLKYAPENADKKEDMETMKQKVNDGAQDLLTGSGSKTDGMKQPERKPSGDGQKEMIDFID
uniref:Conjugal transfer mating pair stabilization protein TraG n=1 Tax=Pectobacterium carotovorum TaxID=554 RepID=A0A0N9NBF3_PECCA|nr:conjugal transfer mating-pair stabilization protein TraG [Pectobacterium carotovorum]ALG88595.1 conjugal transfer mating pair stabilization protein TraG [Pectobacterium carotovorum]